MPSLDQFIEYMEEMRVPKDAKIVCYDHVGMFAVARVAWMFRYFGATDVRIMSGGFKKWMKEKRPYFQGIYDYGEGLPEDGDYDYEVNDSSLLVTDITEVHEMARKISQGCLESQITDARPPLIFKGEVAMPKGLRAGNIHGSLNMPCDSFVDHGIMKEEGELRKVFTEHGIDLNKNTIHSCNSGNTACIVELAWRLAGGV